MQDRELYQQILGLRTPWFVGAIQLDVERRRVEVSVEHPDGTKFDCPECGRSLACYDHAPEREWRHLDTMQFQTILKARVPRAAGGVSGAYGVRQVGVTWAEKGSHFTLLFERLAIDVLLATQTVTGAMAIPGTKWDQTWGIIQRAVARGQTRKQPQPLPRVGLDEKAFSQGHSYITLLYDLDRSTVEAISDGHDTDSGIACLAQLSPEQVQSVEAIAMDMSAAYVQAAKQVIPLAAEKIVHDRFHLMQLATKAVDQVRRAGHRELLTRGDDRLSKTKYVWITSQEHLSEKQQALFDETYTLQLRTGKAWAYKEMLRDLWGQADAVSRHFWTCRKASPRTTRFSGCSACSIPASSQRGCFSGRRRCTRPPEGS